MCAVENRARFFRLALLNSAGYTVGPLDGILGELREGKPHRNEQPRDYGQNQQDEASVRDRRPRNVDPWFAIVRRHFGLKFLKELSSTGQKKTVAQRKQRGKHRMI